MKQWIKLYTEALHDRKMRKLSRYDKSVFYDLLLLAGQEDEDGRLPAIDDIALELDMKVSDAQKSVNHLIDAGIISKDINDNLMITNFQKRQESNLTGYEKVKRYRENCKKVINDNPNDNQMITEEGYQEVINDNPNDAKKITVEKEIEIDKELNNTVNANALTDARGEKSTAAEKQAFGSLHNVMLTPQEYAKLCEQLPDADSKIEAMSLYFGSHGNAKKYKSHYATALNWARMAKERDGSKPKQTQPVNEYPDFYTKLQAEGAL